MIKLDFVTLGSLQNGATLQANTSASPIAEKPLFAAAISKLIKTNPMKLYALKSSGSCFLALESYAPIIFSEYNQGQGSL
jgi:hypothetical protein